MLPGKAGRRSGESGITERVNTLEERETAISRMIVLKSKADAELYGGLEAVKTNLKVLEGKV